MRNYKKPTIQENMMTKFETVYACSGSDLGDDAKGYCMAGKGRKNKGPGCYSNMQGQSAQCPYFGQCVLPYAGNPNGGNPHNK